MSKQSRGRSRSSREPGGAAPAPRLADAQRQLERLERLRQLEALIGAAMGRIFFLGFGDPFHWPGQIERFDGSLVLPPEDVIDEAAEFVAALGVPLRKEICAILGVPPESIHRTYHATEPLSRDEAPEPTLEPTPAQRRRKPRATDRPGSASALAFNTCTESHSASCR